MTTGRINQVTDQRSLGHSQCPRGALARLGTLHCTRRSRLWSRRRPSGYAPGGHYLTGLHTPPPHSRRGIINDSSLDANTQERHARATSRGERLPFFASHARVQRTATFSHRSHRQPTRFFGRSLPPAEDGAPFETDRAGLVASTGGSPPPSKREDLRRGQQRKPGRSVQSLARPPRDHGRAPVAHSLGGNGKVPRQRPSERCHVANDYFPR